MPRGDLAGTESEEDTENQEYDLYEDALIPVRGSLGTHAYSIKQYSLQESSFISGKYGLGLHRPPDHC